MILCRMDAKGLHTHITTKHDTKTSEIRNARTHRVIYYVIATGAIHFIYERYGWNNVKTLKTVEITLRRKHYPYTMTMTYTNIIIIIIKRTTIIVYTHIICVYEYIHYYILLYVYIRKSTGQYALRDSACRLCCSVCIHIV